MKKKCIQNKRKKNKKHESKSELVSTFSRALYKMFSITFKNVSRNARDHTYRIVHANNDRKTKKN